MSTKMIYTCDKCGAEQLDGSQFWTVAVSAHEGLHADDTYHRVNKMSIQVCRVCLEGFGIHAQAETKAKPEYNPPSLEDLIREIVTRSVSKGDLE